MKYRGFPKKKQIMKSYYLEFLLPSHFQSYEIS